MLFLPFFEVTEQKIYKIVSSFLKHSEKCKNLLLTLSCWTQIYSAFANCVDPDQLASEEANWSGCALFAIEYVNLYQQSGSKNLIGWKLDVGKMM